ncbi:2'-5' RNA ligase family protein [Streptomyces sp. NPDC000594]|uniref:2'-5' RNA ligase family protein n=1 Tax=Streptomyces sp. NPDC000594 TaxID=3154261 RepID=UPI0033188FAC
MKPFQFRDGQGSWRTGETLLHFYAEVDWTDPRHRALGALVGASNEALIAAGFPITPVEPEWLHITIDQISSRPASRIGPADRARLVAEVTARLDGVAPFEVTVGSLLSYHSGVIADLHPDQQLAHLHRAVRDGIRAAYGDDACQYPWGLQHLTTAYAHDHADSDAAQRILRRVRPGHAPLHISAVHLVDVAARTTAQGKTVTWDHLAEIPLRGTR